jgi:hypothetical protein
MKVSFVLVALLLFAVACSHNAYTPPARAMAFTSPKTLEKDHTSIRANLSGVTDAFGPSLAAGSLGVRQGLDERLEVVSDLSYLQVTDKSVANTSRGIAMARVGSKYRPTRTDHLAIVAGLGGGFSPAAGSYLSTDVGVVAGYENRSLIPYVGLCAFGSVPLSPKEIDVTGVEDDKQFKDTPEATFGLSLGAGLKVPIGRVALQFGLTTSRLWDNDSSDGFLSIGAGIETSL